ncbi:MAG: ribonucleoside-diphosphate reductase subunit alpha [Candidatus Woesearchaeota archaeon]
MDDLLVTKRNGKIVPYDKQRIHNALQHAFRAKQETIRKEELEELTQAIHEEIHARFKEFYPNVENIQDIVEKHLMRNEHYEVAKQYILYREQRTKERSAKQDEAIKKSYLGKLTVTKRNGEKTLINMKKLQDTLRRATKGYTVPEEDIIAICEQTVKNLYEGVPTTEIEEALILTTTSRIEQDSCYNVIAQRLLSQKIYKELMQESVTDEAFEKKYQETFVRVQEEAHKKGILDERMKEYDVEELAKYLRVERDDLLEYMALRTLHERYFIHTLEGDSIELPQIFWMRVAMGLALAEETPEERHEQAKKFYDILSVMRYTPSTPTLFHAGLKKAQLSSCYLTTTQDDLNDIFKQYSDHAQLSKWSGGIGHDWTNIRATGAMIKSTRVESQGVIPFLKIANDVTAAINRSGKRRGATCAYLETWHLDIEDFVDLRRNTGDERRRTHDMNTANWIPDLFMKRVDNDENWTLFSPEEVPELHSLYGRAFEKKYEEYEKKAQEGKLAKHKVVQAKDLYRRMLSRLFETGHPWFTFKDPCNIRSPQDHAGVIHSSNLCTEITLNTSKEETAVCNLGSINLSRHVLDGSINYELLQHTIHVAVRMLDNVIDLCYYPTTEAKTSNLRHRPIGLGIMGFQDLLFKLKVPFDSQEALTLSSKTQEFIAYHAILGSSKLAREKETYSSYEGSKWSRGILPQDTVALLEQERGLPIEVHPNETLDWSVVRKHVEEYGMRNSNTMAIAPTASISTINACLPSMEPIYKNIYVKSNMTGEFTIINRFLVADLKKHHMWNQEVLDQLKFYDGNVSMIAGVPEELKVLYKEAFQIDPRWALKMSAYRQVWMDQAVSHNVFMSGSSGKLLSDIYMTAWKLGLKTTYYLRSLAKSQIEKSTLDASKYGFTQKREFEVAKEDLPKESASQAHSEVTATTSTGQAVKLCKIEDPDCEACQ